MRASLGGKAESINGNSIWPGGPDGLTSGGDKGLSEAELIGRLEEKEEKQNPRSMSRTMGRECRVNRAEEGLLPSGGARDRERTAAALSCDTSFHSRVTEYTCAQRRRDPFPTGPTRVTKAHCPGAFVREEPASGRSLLQGGACFRQEEPASGPAVLPAAW